MGLLRMAARTAVVAGTATAVHGRVQRRQAAKYDEQDQQQYAQEPAGRAAGAGAGGRLDRTAPEPGGTAHPGRTHRRGVRSSQGQDPRNLTDAEAQRGTSLNSRPSATRSSSNTSPHDGDSPFRMGQLRVRWVQARGMSPALFGHGHLVTHRRGPMRLHTTPPAGPCRARRPCRVHSTFAGRRGPERTTRPAVVRRCPTRSKMLTACSRHAPDLAGTRWDGCRWGRGKPAS